MKKAMERLSEELPNANLRWFDDFNYEDIDFDLDNLTPEELKQKMESEDYDEPNYSVSDIWSDCFGYELVWDNGFYTINEHYREKLGDDFDFFNLIAEYIEDGGYCEFYGADGSRFRYTIKNNKCIEQYPKIIWE